MTIYSNSHLCGTHDPICVWTNGTDTFVDTGECPNMITIDADPLRKAMAALEAFEASKKEAAQ